MVYVNGGKHTHRMDPMGNTKTYTHHKQTFIETEPMLTSVKPRPSSADTSGSYGLVLVHLD